MSGTTLVSRYQKGKTRKVKTNLNLLEQEIVSGSGICWLYASLHLIPDNHANIPPLNFLQAGCPSCCPTNGIKALKANITIYHTHTHTHNRFTALWNLSGTTRVSRYQKKHSPTHTHRGHQSSQSAFSIYYEP